MPSSRPRRPGRTLATLIVVALLVAGGLLAWNKVTGAERSFTARCVAGTDGDAAALTLEQSDIAALIGAIALERELPARALTIAIATAMQESRLRNLDYGDRDSLGVFQQRPSQDWGTAEQVMDPYYATNAFFDVLVTIEGYRDLEVTDAAQRVQRSAFPNAYAQHESLARLFASAMSGYSPGTLTCRLPAVDPETASGLGDRLVERLALDLPSLAAQADSERWVISAVALGAGDRHAERMGWAVATWVLMTAEHTGASVVTVNGQVWQRADGAEASWRPLAEGEPGYDDAAGVVGVR
ncbi:hypothetical protein [Ruania albidiflava]|uniref:hypothetical protein n=1 Tax=Ruania albidiflava TaxID=366586 RepID=UPI000415D144|nr:hypothetical protein [Ruania albidiflava]